MSGHQGSGAPPERVGGGRLVTWKAIAAYLGRDVKTVRRWETERGLPVYRAPGEARSTVYAIASELECWLRSGGESPDAGPTGPEVEAPPVSESEPPPLLDVSVRAASTGPIGPRRVRLAVLAAAAAAVVVAGAAGIAAVRAKPAPAPVRERAEAGALYLQGVHQWNLRTPTSLARAVDLFTQAVVRDPTDARAYAGLASSYNLLREYTVLPAAQALPRAEAAARRAVALDPGLADAHATLAFVLAWWRWDAKGADAEFSRALELDPHLSKAWHWRATWRLARGEIAPALADIERALALAPESDAIVADRALILFFAGRAAEAVAILQGLETERPEFQSPHAYLAEIHMAQQDWPAWLDELAAAASLRHAPEREAVSQAGRQGLAKNGRAGMWRAIIAEQERLRREGRLTRLDLGGSYALAGRRDDALREVAAGVAAHEMDAVSLPSAIAYAGLRRDPEFLRLIAPTGGGGPG